MFFSWPLTFASVTALWESSQGRTLFGKLTYPTLWCPGITEDCTSQSFADPYSPTHFEHGLLFNAFFSWLLPGEPLSSRLSWAIAIESSWEAVENSEWGIKNYRSKGYPDYKGDSILNSMSDILFTAFGFWFGSSYLSSLQCLQLAGAIDATLYFLYGDCLLRNILKLIGILKD